MKPMKELTFTKHNYMKGGNNSNRLAYNSFISNENMPTESPDIMREKIHDMLNERVPESRFVELMESKKKRIITEVINFEDFNCTNILYKSDNFVYNNYIQGSYSQGKSGKKLGF